MTTQFVQAVASAFYKERTEKAFATFYAKLSNGLFPFIKKILKDNELAHECVSNVFFKIWVQKDTFVFDESKNYISWLFTTAKNEAIGMYNKQKKNLETPESEFQLDEDEEGRNILDYFAQNHGDNSLLDNEEIVIDDSLNFHDNKAALCHRAKELMTVVCRNEEEANIMIDAFFNGFGTLEIKEMYGFDSRITVTTRKRRTLRRIKEQLDIEVNCSKFKSKELENGDVFVRYPNRSISISLSMCGGKLEGNYTTYFESSKKPSKMEKKDMMIFGQMKTQAIYRNGKRNGRYLEYNSKGVLMIEGQYKADNKVGIWKRFHDNGKLSEVLDVETKDYVLYDENGEFESHGNLDGCGIEVVNCTYLDNTPKVCGLKHQGRRTGLWKHYYNNGKVSEIADYVQKKYFAFDEEGHLEEEGEIVI